MSIKLGPFSAAFEGEAQVTVDAAAHSGHVEGKGTDKRGGSRSKLVLDYRLDDTGAGTKVDVDADVQLVGPIAQFGRTGIVNETANVLIRQFVQNVEAKLNASPAPAAPSAATASAAATGEAAGGAASAAASAAAPGQTATSAPSSPRPAPDVRSDARAGPLPPANQINVFSLLGAVIASWFRRLFGRAD